MMSQSMKFKSSKKAYFYERAVNTQIENHARDSSLNTMYSRWNSEMICEDTEIGELEKTKHSSGSSLKRSVIDQCHPGRPAECTINCLRIDWSSPLGYLRRCAVHFVFWSFFFSSSLAPGRWRCVSVQICNAFVSGRVTTICRRSRSDFRFF